MRARRIRVPHRNKSATVVTKSGAKPDQGVKRCGWYSFYRFSVMAKMQIAVDEGATRRLYRILGLKVRLGMGCSASRLLAL